MKIHCFLPSHFLVGIVALTLSIGAIAESLVADIAAGGGIILEYLPE